MNSSGKPYLVLQYEWDLTGIIDEGFNNGTILSRMIEFHKEKPFRVGLKSKSYSNYTILFLSTDLNKLGLKVVQVNVSYPSDPTQTTSLEANKEETGSIQLFTASSNWYMASKNPVFTFHIYLMPIILENYQVEQRDQLLKEKLWTSSGTDYELMAYGRKFPVHQWVLAARSPGFVDEFKTHQNNQSMHHADADCMEQFIDFIYTGELVGQVTSQLNQLATTYQIKTLESICQSALSDDSRDLASLALQMKPEGELRSTQIKPDIDSEIRTELNALALEFTWNVEKYTEYEQDYNVATSQAFEYQNEKLIRAQVKSSTCKMESKAKKRCFLSKIIVIGYQEEKSSYKIVGVDYSLKESGSYNNSLEKGKLEETSSNEGAGGQLLPMFTGEIENKLYTPFTITFNVRLGSKVKNFHYTFIDSLWKDQLWAASVNKQRTDVEFLVGREVFGAHRHLLSARSPVFAAMLKSGMNESRTGKIRIDDLDSTTFFHFLKFLYTGEVESSAKTGKLFSAADKYQVKTLMDICPSLAADVKSTEMDDFTAALLSF